MQVHPYKSYLVVKFENHNNDLYVKGYSVTLLSCEFTKKKQKPKNQKNKTCVIEPKDLRLTQEESSHASYHIPTLQSMTGGFMNHRREPTTAKLNK